MFSYGVSHQVFVRRFLHLTAGVAFATLSCATWAQSWPTKPVNMIVPFAAGGPLDVLARVVATALGERLGQPVVVENKSGAGGNIGGAAATRAAPDGYTLLMSTPGPVMTNKLLYKSLNFDPVKDLEPIVLVSDSPMLLAVNPKTPIKDLKQAIAFARQPGALTVGNPGIGTLGHITTEYLFREAKAKPTMVPYKGSAPLITDLIGGQVMAGMDFLPTYMPYLKDGKLRAVAVTTAKRLAVLPDVPTVAEAGLGNFEAVGWYALFAPKGTPRAIIERVNHEVNAWLKTDEAKSQLDTLVMRPLGGTPAELSSYIGDELKKWEPVIKAANISLD